MVVHPVVRVRVRVAEVRRGVEVSLGHGTTLGPGRPDPATPAPPLRPVPADGGTVRIQRAGAAFTLAVLGVLVGPAGPAAAEHDDETAEMLAERVVEDALFAVLDEVWLATHLGMLDRGSLGPMRPLADLDLHDPAADDLADLLLGAELFAEDVLADADAAGIPLGNPLRTLLARQGDAARDPATVVQGAQEVLVLADTDVRDLVDTFGLLRPPEGGAAPAAPPPAPGDRTDPPATVAPAADTVPAPAADDGTPGTAATAPAPLAAPGTEPAAASPLPALAAGVGVTLLGATLLARRRRRGGSHGGSSDVSALVVQAGRQLTAALDPDQVASLAADAALTTTGASSARLAQPGDAAEVVRAAVVDGSPHTRTVDGTTVVAVPCVGDGRVLGVLVVVSPSRPDADRILAGLAGFVGPALAAADRHGSAVDVDGLTRTFNRRRLDRDLGRLVTPGRLVSLVMLDVDHFKRFNDDHGHAAGDEVLRRVADAVRGSIRPTDVLYRYGGEEFCILLADTTTSEAADVCERVRAAVESTAVTHDGAALPTVTVSLGVAATDDGRADVLAGAADAALYDAKRQGRNRVLVATA